MHPGIALQTAESLTVECDAQTDSLIEAWLENVGGAGVGAHVQCDNKAITWSHNYDEEIRGRLQGGE